MLCGAILLGPARASDLARLQGKWQGDGLLVITGKKLDYTGVNTNAWLQASFSLREDATARRAIVTILDCGYVPLIGKTAAVTYQLQGNTLSVTATNFGHYHFSFKKTKVIH